MKEEMKLNAVKNLMQSLDFSREEKEALLLMLQQELGADAKTEQPAEKYAPPQEYGPRLLMQVMFEDGTTGEYRDRAKKIVGIVVKGSGRQFVLYSAQHYCAPDTPLSEAIRYAADMPKVRGKAWRVLTVNDCQIIYHQFRAVNAMLDTIGCRKIVESNTIGVLTSDGSMAGHKGWQVWFAMDI